MKTLDLLQALPEAMTLLEERGEPVSVAAALQTLGVALVPTLRHSVADASPHTPRDGDLVSLGRFQLLAELGRGGMGRVIEARDPELRRSVAVKVVVDPAEVTEAQLARFVAEAQITGQLQHPNIVPVHEMGVSEDGLLYFVMKKVDGRSLGEVIAALRAGDEAATTEWPRTKLLHAFIQICNAVAYAHDRGVLHRDLKPDNIMLGPFGEVLVMDWGVARLMGDATETVSRKVIEKVPVAKTLDGTVIGTPGFMSPEQSLGRLHLLDGRSDVWSLGAVLYELLTLRPAYSAPDLFALMYAVTNGPPADPRERAPEQNIPDEVAELCLRALASERAARCASAAELGSAVEAFLEGSKRRQEARKRARVRRTLVSLAIAALTIFGVAMYGQWQNTLHAEREAALLYADNLVSMGLSQTETGSVAAARELIAQARVVYEQRSASLSRVEMAESVAALAAPPPIWTRQLGETHAFHGFDRAGARVLITRPLTGVAEVLDMASGALLARFDASPNRIEGATWLDAELAAVLTRSPGGEVSVVEVASGRVRSTISEGIGPGALTLFDGGLIEWRDGGWLRWSLDLNQGTGTERGHFIAQPRGLSVDRFRAISADGRVGWGFLVRPGDPSMPRAARVLNLVTGQILMELKDIFPVAALHPAGTHFAWSDGDHVHVEEISSGERWSRPVPFGDEVTWAADGSSVYVINTRGRALKFSADGSDEVPVPVRLFNELGFWPSVEAGPGLIRGKKGGWIAGWSAGSRVSEAVVGRGWATSVFTSADGLIAGAVSVSGELRLWDSDSLAPITSGSVHEGIWEAFLLPDARVVTAHDDGVVRISDPARGEVVSELPDPGHGSVQGVLLLEPGGTELLAAYADGWVLRWNLATATVEPEFRALEGKPWRQRLSPDGRLVALTGRDGKTPGVVVWDLEQRRLVFSSAQHEGYGVEFLDSGTVAWGSNSGHIRVADIASGQIRYEVWVDPRPVTSLRVSPDDRLLAAASWDGTIHLHDAQTGREVFVYGATSTPNELQFSPDGTQLFWVTDAGRIHRFDLALHKRYEDLGADDDSPASAHLLAGRAYALRGSWDRAVEQLTAARGSGGDVSHLELARALWASRSAHDARVELEAAKRSKEADESSLSLWLAAPDPAKPL